MHSLCMGSAHHEGQPAGICERRWSLRTSSSWPSQVRKCLLPSEDLPEICLILLLPQGCQGHQWKWERAASSRARPVGSGSLQESSCWAKMLCESLALLSWKIKRRFTSVLVGTRSRQEATCFEAAENSKLSSWSGHQRSNVPSAQLGRNSISWLMLFFPYS